MPFYDWYDRKRGERTYVCLWTSCKHFQYHMLCTNLLRFSKSPTGSFITETKSRASAHEWTERQPPNVSHIVFAGELQRGWRKGQWEPWHFDFDIGQAGSFVQGADHRREAASEKRKAALRPRAAPAKQGRPQVRHNVWELPQLLVPLSWLKKGIWLLFHICSQPPHHDQTATMRGSQKDMGKEVLGKTI